MWFILVLLARALIKNQCIAIRGSILRFSEYIAILSEIDSELSFKPHTQMLMKKSAWALYVNTAYCVSTLVIRFNFFELYEWLF